MATSEEYEHCYFQCEKTDTLITAGSKRIENIIKASQQRGDLVHRELAIKLAESELFTIRVHKSCVCTYTSQTHISRLLTKRGLPDHERSASAPPHRRRRSEGNQFVFKEHCIICGDKCKPVDPRHPDRWRKISQVLTADRLGHLTLKEHLIKTCNERGDELSDEVLIRLSGATADLHAADAQYHRDCCQKFLSWRNVESAQSTLNISELAIDLALQNVIAEMTRDKSVMWTTVEIHDLYLQSTPDIPYSRRKVISMICDHFGNDIIEMRIVGCASFICFTHYVPHKLCKLEDDNDDILDCVTNKIFQEVSEVPKPKDYNLNQFNKVNSIALTSPTLLRLISKLMSSGEVVCPSLSIAHAIQSAISKASTPTTLGLGIKLHHKFGSKELVCLLHEYGFCCSYDEVLRFKVSAAKFIGDQDIPDSMGLRQNGNPISHWFDNYDLQVFTPNGLKETHSMAIEHMQVMEQNVVERVEDEEDAIIIPRLSKVDMRSTHLSDYSNVHIEHYSGTTNPIPPEFDILERPMNKSPACCVDEAVQQDILWMSTLTSENPAVEWSGSMTRSARATRPRSRATKFVFGPLIDAPPSNPDTVLTTLVFIEQFVKKHGQTYLHVTADMQLYRVAMMVKWANPLRWKQLFVRPGGMHTIMSFIGCIGTLMQGTGLDDILNAAFKGVPNMLNGKAWPKATRGLRMVVTCLLERHIGLPDQPSPEALDHVLDSARSTPTGRLWVDCLVIPVHILHLFIRAEREGNWILQQYAMQRMIPYFFAAGHWQYSRYITWHVNEMKNGLPKDILDFYLSGQHVCRHRDDVWNGVSGDQFGEQTYIRYGKARGGLVGLTLSADQVAGWVLSNNICNMVSLSMDKMFGEIDEDFDCKSNAHKEEGNNRIRLDTADRNKLKDKLKTLLHPLQPETNELINIVTGCVASENVNVHNALDIGERMAYNFQLNLPDGFYKPLRQEVVTMAVMKKSVKIGDSNVYDMEKLFGRMLVLSQKRDIELSTVFKYELAPVPSSLFDEYGHLRKSSKSQLLQKLGVPDTTNSQADVRIYDGNEMIYQVMWPRGSTLQHFINIFIRAVTNPQVETYVIFDKYDEMSPKNHERNRRAGNQVLRDYSVTLNMELPSRDLIMKNTRNKKKLIKLLCDTVTSATLHLIGEEQCMFRHEEADVNIVTYVSHVIATGSAKNIEVVADDNDIFALLMHFTAKWSFPGVQIRMKKSNGLLIDINSSVQKLGENCTTLLALHALTGCDSTSYPFGKGKAAAINLMTKCHLHLDSIGNPLSNKSEVIEAGHRLFCHMYGSNSSDMTLSQLRYDIYSKKRNSPKIRSLPPTDEAAEQHFLRAHFQCALWKSADDKGPPNLDILKHGWEVVNGAPQPVVGVSQFAPIALLQLVACGCVSDSSCSRKSCSCKANAVSCTSYCKCTGQDSCHNPNTIHIESLGDDSDDGDDGEDGDDEDETDEVIT